MTSEKVVNGKTQKSSFPMWKSYIVYNRDQCEGLPEYVPQEQSGAAPIESAQSIVDGMKNAPRITVCDSDRAFYMPSADSITMPRLAQFYNAESYYSTMFHEMAHSTGHKSRLNRPGVMESQGFGSESYSKEELVAEITAAFLCGEAGILDKVEQNSKAYVQNWASRIGKEPKILLDAIGQAQKAADCILGVTFGKEGAEE
jgi:antirestriction protein ArdC